MRASPLMSGVLAPVVTPFKPDYTPDRDRYLKHCRWLAAQNCGLAVFGTNSEANSLSLEERMSLLDMLVEAGVDAKRMMPGTTAPTSTMAVALCIPSPWRSWCAATVRTWASRSTVTPIASSLRTRTARLWMGIVCSPCVRWR